MIPDTLRRDIGTLTRDDKLALATEMLADVTQSEPRGWRRGLLDDCCEVLRDIRLLSRAMRPRGY